jgi:uroporphyrinogen-III synthase
VKDYKDILSGKRIVLTRALHQNNKFIELLKQHGAIPIPFPTIEIHPIEDTTLIDVAIQSIYTFDYLIFTSSNAVEIFHNRFKHLTGSFVLPNKLKIIAVGKSTASVLSSNGINNTKVPEEFMAMKIPDILGDVSQSKILIPCSALAKDELAENLELIGAEVHYIKIYENRTPEIIDVSVLDNHIDYITFTSPSTVDGWLKIIKKHNIVLSNEYTVVAIGNVTADAATKAGIKVDITAKEHTIEGMIDSMIEHENSLKVTANN